MNQIKNVSKLEIRDLYMLVKLCELRLRYLESAKWTTVSDEVRVAEMHKLNVLWSKLIASLDSLKATPEDRG